MKRSRCNVTICIVVLLVGCVFSASVAGMQLAGKVNLDQFYDVGEIYEFPYTKGVASGVNWRYDGTRKQIEIIDENAFIDYIVNGDDFAWRYIEVQIEDLNVPELKWQLCFINSDQQIVGEMSVYLTEGSNTILIDINAEKFSTIRFTVNEQTSVRFYVNSVVLYENEPIFEMKSYMGQVGGILCIYLLLTIILWKIFGNWIRRINWYAPIYLLEKWFLAVSKVLCEGVSGILRLSGKARSRVRRWLLFIMFTIMIITDATSYYNKNTGYNYLLMFCIIQLLLITIFMMEKPFVYLYWRNGMVVCWCILWGMACLSDFVVHKRFQYTGYVMLLVMGLLFYAWGNMERPTEFVRDIICAVRMSFLPAYLFCILFRPMIVGSRYSGISTNPIPFAMYLNIVILSFCASLLEKQQRRGRRSFHGMLTDVIAILTATYMEWKTQSTFSIIALVVIFISFLIQGIRVDIRIRNKRFACILLIIGIFVYPVFAISDWGLHNISAKYGTQLIFKNDAYKIEAGNYCLPGTDVVYASTLSNSRIVNKLVNSNNMNELTSGRTQFYRIYIQKMNLWGHSDRATLFGNKSYAHNAILMIAYRYGVFAAIPYAMLMAFFVILAGKNLWRNSMSMEAWFLFAVSWSVGFMMMCDNLEQPFRWINWPIYYMGMGYFFTVNDKRRKLE